MLLDLWPGVIAPAAPRAATPPRTFGRVVPYPDPTPVDDIDDQRRRRDEAALAILGAL